MRGRLPARAAGLRSYLVAHTPTHWTGFPMVQTTSTHIQTERFPLPDITEFRLEALRFVRIAHLESEG